MTNKTVTMSRELAEAFDRENSPPPKWAVEQLRALLAAPVVERQEPVCYVVKGRWGVSAYLEEVIEALKIRRRLGFTDEYPSPPAPVAVPEGWRLVPIEPTMRMLEALMEWREVGNVNAYNNILDSAPAYLDKVKELNQ